MQFLINRQHMCSYMSISSNIAVTLATARNHRHHGDVSGAALSAETASYGALPWRSLYVMDVMQVWIPYSVSSATRIR